MKTVDLNADCGESYGPWKMGDDAGILDIVTSANIACGGHAGDPDTMAATLALAKARGTSVGAHPGFDDKPGFGRRIIPMKADAIERMVRLARDAGALGAKLTGAGGGGAVIALVAEADAARVQGAWQQAGFEAFTTSVAPTE